MPTDFAFRLSTYLSLGLACLCLGYSEWDLVPEVTGFTAVVIATLIASFVLNGRVELDLRQANRLGLVIGVLAAAWIGWQFAQANKESLIYQLPWPASLLPYLGPLLMVLIPAKLLRPKHAGDWWALEGIGAATVGLACAIAEDGVFVVLLLSYAVAAAWAAGLFFFRRTAGEVPPIPGAPVGARVAVHSGPPGRGLLRPAAGWAAAAAAVAFPLFLLTPRAPVPIWHFGKGRIEVGFSGAENMDLSRTGDMTASRDEAFRVRAYYPGDRPKDDLSPVQRWRGPTLTHYEHGKWTAPLPTGQGLLFVERTAFLSPDLPDLGPDAYRLDVLPGLEELPRPVLADPVTAVPGRAATVAYMAPFVAWVDTGDGSFHPLAYRPGVMGGGVLYRQICLPTDDPDLGPAFELNGPRAEALRPYCHVSSRLTGPESLGRLAQWARDDVLGGLVRGGRLPEAVLERAGPGTLAPGDYEAVAREFRRFFATSPEFHYDLQLRRQDPDADPVEDFVFNTKVGHCQRFASALALSLRAVGVPTRLVTGFKGCEHTGKGEYSVRQESAHAWVEALVPRPAPADFPPPPDQPGRPRPAEVWHWLTLDPDPATLTEAGPAAPAETWLGLARQTGRDFFADFVTGYDQERRRRTVAAVADHLGDNQWWYAGGLLLAAATAAGVAVRRSQRLISAPSTKPAPPTGVGWYDEMVATLARAGHPVRAGQTPAGHARGAGAALGAAPGGAELAGIPEAVARAFYEVRYAGRPLAADQQAVITAAVGRLAAGLRTGNPHA